MPGGEANVGVECRGEGAEQGDGRFGAPSSMHSVSSSAMSARAARSATVVLAIVARLAYRAMLP